MATDWIPISVHLANSPEVFALAERTRRSPDEVIGQLVRFWSWAQAHTPDGKFPGYTLDTLAKCARVSTSFLRGMASVGWLESSPTGTEIPKFEKWFGKDAKRRVATARRVREYRRRQTLECNADVTPARYTPPHTPSRTNDDDENKNSVVVERTNERLPQHACAHSGVRHPPSADDVLRQFHRYAGLWPGGQPRTRRDRELLFRVCTLAADGCDWAVASLKTLKSGSPRNPGAYLQKLIQNTAPSDRAATIALTGIPVPPEIGDPPPPNIRANIRAAPLTIDPKPDPTEVRAILHEAMAALRHSKEPAHIESGVIVTHSRVADITHTDSQ